MSGLVAFVQAALVDQADPTKAGPMAAYLKTDMPFYGVPTPPRRLIAKEALRRFAPGTPEEYRSMVLDLWTLPHREEKYLAIGIATGHSAFITFDQLDLYRQLIVEGAWWDFVDTIAVHLVGRVLFDERAQMRPVLDQWVDGEDLWLRRTSIISQLDHKEATDSAVLFDYCTRRAHEKEFFIRKAIGWALRQYARTNPVAVTEYLIEHRDELSGLSFREAAKHLNLS